MTKEERKVHDREYRESHKESFRAARKRYLEANKDAIKSYNKRYYEANKDVWASRDKKYYLLHAEEIKARALKYKQDHPKTSMSNARKYHAKRAYGLRASLARRLFLLTQRGLISKQEAKNLFETLGKKDTINKIFSIKLQGAQNG